MPESVNEHAIFICQASALENSGKGVRFPVKVGGMDTSGFVVRFNGTVYGYLNRCAHVPIELDWSEGNFFNLDGSYLMCATHGAMYAAESGRCLGGPCRGGRLRPIIVIEQDNQVFWQPDEYIKPPQA